MTDDLPSCPCGLPVKVERGIYRGYYVHCEDWEGGSELHPIAFGETPDKAKQDWRSRVEDYE